MSSKKKMGRPKNKKRVNPQEEEELEKEVSSHSHIQNSSEHEELGKKSSSSSRLTQSSSRKLGISPSNPVPVLEPFYKTYVRKKKRFPSSTQETESPQLKIPGVSSIREARFLTRSSAKNKGKLVEPLIAEVQSLSEEIHVTESEAEILREARINTLTVIVKKRRSLVLSDSSSSSSHHSIPAP